MRDSCYLRFDANGIRGMTKSAPTLKAGEYAVRVVMRAPEVLFTRDLPTAEINIPAEAVIEPVVEVTDPPPPPEADDPGE